MNPFRNSLYYFGVFRRYVGKRLYIVFVLSVLGALVEGIGITMLLPLLGVLHLGNAPDPQAASGPIGEEDVPALQEFVGNIVSYLGVEDSITGILVLIAAVFLTKGLIMFAEGAYLSHLQAQLMREVRGKLFDLYSTMDYRYYSRTRTGHFINLLSEQVRFLVDSFTNYKQFVATFIAVIAYFMYAALLNWLFASIALIAGAGILLLFRRLNQFVQRLSRKEAEEAGVFNHLVVQALQGFKYIAATARVGPLRHAVLRSVRQLRDYQRTRGYASHFTRALQEPVAVTALVAIIIVHVAVMGHALAPILVAVLLIYRAIGQIVSLQGKWQSMMSRIGSLEIVEKEFERLYSNQEANGPKDVGPLDQALEFRNVGFSYVPDEGKALDDITLTIQGRESVAFVGESGAGKSTFVDILTLLLRPDEGEFLIDGIPHWEVNLRSWRSQIGYVSQELVIFDDTVANNISLWSGNYDQDPEVRRRVEASAASAHLDSFIESLPEGFNTRVGDRGIRLSGGQRQRLFIARELYKEPRLLILDEATSALDSLSESLVQESVDKLRGKTTVVMIAHRLATIRNADYIYVLEKGRIVERGTYEELTRSSGGTFSRMVARQAL